MHESRVAHYSQDSDHVPPIIFHFSNERICPLINNHIEGCFARISMKVVVLEFKKWILDRIPQTKITHGVV